MIRALAIHLLKCMAEAEIDAFECSPALKGGVNHYRNKWVSYFLNDPLKKSHSMRFSASNDSFYYD